jgi:hypothetical protein
VIVRMPAVFAWLSEAGHMSLLSPRADLVG